MNGNRDKFFFFSFSAYLLPFWLKIIPERDFLIFLIFFSYFFRNFLARAEYERNSGLKLFSLFLGQSHPVLPKYNTGKGFLIFSIFLLFFSEFSSPGRVWTEFRTKIFFHSFSIYLIPFWLKLMSKRDFFIFWFFFSIFLRIFLPGPSMNGIRD